MKPPLSRPPASLPSRSVNSISGGAKRATPLRSRAINAGVSAARSNLKLTDPLISPNAPPPTGAADQDFAALREALGSPNTKPATVGGIHVVAGNLAGDGERIGDLQIKPSRGATTYRSAPSNP